MRIARCWYCSANVYPGHGVKFIRNDCKSFTFCGKKCHNHFKKRHNPRKSKWTKASRKFKGKEMLLDSTYEFEKQRNLPVKYDRQLWMKSVQALLRVNEIRRNRQLRYQERRFRQAHSKMVPLAARLAEKHSILLHGPKVPEHADMSKIVRKTLNKKKAISEKKVHVERQKGLHMEAKRVRLKIRKSNV